MPETPADGGVTNPLRSVVEVVVRALVDQPDAVNVTVISLDQAPQGYEEFDRGAAKKYVLDPHGLIPS